MYTTLILCVQHIHKKKLIKNVYVTHKCYNILFHKEKVNVKTYLISVHVEKHSGGENFP